MYLVTGSAGFIGFHLSKLLLEQNKKVIGIDNLNNYYDVKLKKDRIKILKKFKNFKFYKLSLENKSSAKKIFLKHKILYTINLAAQAGVRYSVLNPDAYISSNINGFFNILDLSRIYKVKHFVYASTSSVYGKSIKFPLKENVAATHPIQLYAATKRSNELIAHSYSSIFNLPTTGLRFFTVYGPYGRPDMSIFKFASNIINNKKIDVFNKGNHSRDFTYVDDIVKSISLIIKKIPSRKKSNKKEFLPDESEAPFNILNIGGSKSIKLTNYISLIEKNLKKKSKKNLMSLQKGDVIKTQACNKKIKKLINYTPTTSIQMGIKRYIQWFKKYYNFNE